MGFCMFANVAVAIAHARATLGIGRVAVVDWDVHHGNGTSEIFDADPSVLFCSIHESPLYPGTGAAGDVGSGPGTGLTVNLPVPGGSGDAVFGSLVEHVAAPIARAYAPELILVSAGFDAHADDPLSSCTMTEAGYAGLARSVRRLGVELGAPVGVVLEGGYALGALARSIVATLEALAGALGPEADALLADHPLADRARDRLRPYWPSL